MVNYLGWKKVSSENSLHHKAMLANEPAWCIRMIWVFAPNPHITVDVGPRFPSLPELVSFGTRCLQSKML